MRTQCYAINLKHCKWISNRPTTQRMSQSIRLASFPSQMLVLWDVWIFSSVHESLLFFHHFLSLSLSLCNSQSGFSAEDAANQRGCGGAQVDGARRARPPDSPSITLSQHITLTPPLCTGSVRMMEQPDQCRQTGQSFQGVGA